MSNEIIKIINLDCKAHLCGNMEEYRQLNIACNESIRGDHQRYWDDETRRLEDVVGHDDKERVFLDAWTSQG